jgi:hypothetical protein
MDHFIDFSYMIPEMIRDLNANMLMIHADPPSFGEEFSVATMRFLKKISQNQKANLQFETIKGTHHFHMSSPKETAQLILKFFNKIKNNV